MNNQQTIHQQIDQLTRRVEHMHAKERSRATRWRVCSRRVTRAAMLVGLAIGSVPLISSALDPVPAGQVMDGDVITARDWNDNFKHLVDAITVVEQQVRECPDDMTRIGAHCIDKSMSPVATWLDASQGCHDEGKDLCSIDLMAACDHIEPEESLCTSVTDGIVGVWVSTPGLVDAANWTNSVVRLGPEDGGNVVHMQHNNTELHASFCCSPLIWSGMP